jgi:hypothetical protein
VTTKENYVTPESDDVIKRLAEILTVSEQFWLVIHALASYLEGGGLLAKIKMDIL